MVNLLYDAASEAAQLEQDRPRIRVGMVGSSRQYYRDVAVNGKDVAWETVIGKTSSVPALVISVPIEVNGSRAGVLAAAMSIEDVSRLVGELKLGRTGHAFLVDEGAKVVAHPREEFVLAQTHLNDHALVSSFLADGQPHLRSFVQSDGKRVLGAVRGNRFGWAVAVQQDEDELFAPLRRAAIVAGWLLAFSAVLLALIARASSRMLIRPIIELTYAADAMSMGELERTIPSSRRDEIGVLAQSLERLRRSVKAAMDRLRPSA